MSYSFTNKCEVVLITTELEWDASLVSKYNLAGPRYTSYPTALEFSDDYQLNDYLDCLNNVAPEKSLSLYIHIPFCQNICYYCACNKVVTKDRSKSEQYVDSLIKEIQLVGQQLNTKVLRQIHWGGGTPTFLSLQQIGLIMQTISDVFDIPDKSEISIEIDPRALFITDIQKLFALGFNRMSIGVQDFDLKVQQSINRVQSFEMTRDMMSEARRCGFQSISVDLIYGLPHQTLSTFEETLTQLLEISPDRISVFNYAHLPHRFKPQRRIASEDLPIASEKLAIFEYIMTRLQNAGYLCIGMDHFAKPEDELAIAQKSHCLHRNFQGYTTHEEYELIGVGVSSIGALNDQYHQNVRDLPSYYAALDNNQLPCWRGAKMSQDDKIRKAVIFELICHFRLSKKEVEAEYHINFNEYFRLELELLKPFIEDGLVVESIGYVEVTRKGKLFIRNICMTFDSYFNEVKKSQSYSKVI